MHNNYAGEELSDEELEAELNQAAIESEEGLEVMISVGSLNCL